MKQIYQIRKQCAKTFFSMASASKLLFCLLVLSLVSISKVVGQETEKTNYVTGNYYIGRKIDLNGVQVNLEPRGIHYKGNVPINNNAIIDGIHPNTWWTANQSGEVTITITFDDPIKVSHLQIYGGGKSEERAENVKVEGFNFGQEPTSIKEKNFDNQNVKDYMISLDNESLYSNYKITLTPFEKENIICLEEIVLYEESNVSITHKPAKWHKQRINEGYGDTFSDKEEWFYLGNITGVVNKEIQATHTYIDTIYVHEGSSVKLSLPDKLGNESATRSYQRWYSFRTDGLFEVEQNNKNNPEGVVDLLTPSENDKNKFIRLKNGYVGYPLYDGKDGDGGALEMNFYFPTKEQFEKWKRKKNDDNFQREGIDNRWYIVACDVSGYTDYKLDAGTMEEPTLTHRVLFYIVNVDHRGENESELWKNGHGRLTNSEYQNGTNTGSEKYLEEYEINYPAIKLPAKGNYVKNLVALSKDANAYAIPGAKLDTDTDVLTVNLKENSAGISLYSIIYDDSDGVESYVEGENTIELTGERRVISFDYPRDEKTGLLKVPDGSTATILVTKTVEGKTYNIARYKLTFSESATLLPSAMLEKAGNFEESHMNADLWNKFYYRTREHLSENYELLTSLNWDYNKNNSNGGTKGEYYYQFPMNWDFSSYGFYDGSKGNDYRPSKNDRYYPEWGFYAIMDGFMENGIWPSKNSSAQKLKDSKYHLYVDASDRPGTIAKIPFRADLCAGSQLFVTAWVKSAGWDEKYTDAGMLFTILGVKEDGSQIPLYRHSTGQIRRTDYLEENFGVEGVGEDTNNWLQTYFTFINPQSSINYDSYILQIDNNSASTLGGDMYLDNIRVYLAKPSGRVEQKELACADKQSDRTLVQFSMDWARLFSRIGGDIIEGEDAAIDFCFVDTVKFNNIYNNNKDVLTALKASAVRIGGKDSNFNQQVASLSYKIEYDDNEVIYSGNTGLAKDHIEDGKAWFYRASDDETKMLKVDFRAELVPYRGYWVLVHPHNNESDLDLSLFKNFLTDKCEVSRSAFTVDAASTLLMNGQIIDPEETFCVGQVYNFSVDLRVPKPSGEEGYISVGDKVYFDWFFGEKDSETEFTTPSDSYIFSIMDALNYFRAEYPEAESLEGVTARGQLDDNHIKVLSTLINNKQLILYRQHLNISLPEDLNLIVKPIEREFTPDELAEMGFGENVEDNLKICWGYLPLDLKAEKPAPTLYAGFSHFKYPEEYTQPALRIGLEQIWKATSTPLTIDLRKPTLAYPAKHTKVGMVTEEAGATPIYNKVYLIDTDDPEYTLEDIKAKIPVGTVHELQSSTDDDNDNKYTNISFDISEKEIDGHKFKFNPKEGYTYHLMIYFEEKGDISENMENICINQLIIPMKVVPQYLKWVGSETDNWNNDEYWKRIIAPEKLKKKEDDKTYLGDNPTHEGGFVPMLFTKVLLPEGNKATLYMPEGQNDSWAENSNRPENMNAPTKHIEFDLMAYDKENYFRTRPYRVNLLNEIHFEPGAEMLHSEYLLYKKAWVDYRLQGKKWHMLASPLKAVVAGDFYTDKRTGSEEQEYFTDINFSPTSPNVNNASEENDRYAPAVFQRGWKKAAQMQLKGENSTTSSVAIGGNWSGVYNDVTVPYQPGSGFSLNVQKLPGTETNSLFRLPKADTEYSYYSSDKKDSENAKHIDKGEDYGRLIIDALLKRTETPETDNNSESPINVDLSEQSANGMYYLVGNPFMAHLDMKKFFEANVNLAPVYWTSEDGVQDIVVADETSWISVDDEDVASIAPLRSFFVKLKDENQNSGNSVIFNADMQTLSSSARDADESRYVLRMTATTAEGKKSRAAVAYDGAANEQYVSGEDAELFLDSNLSDVPALYTVAGSVATSINRTASLWNIPIGIYGGEKGKIAKLSFTGLSTFGGAVLYDAVKKQTMPLSEGQEVEIVANTHGRYFLRSATPTGNEQIRATDRILVYSLATGKVVVVSAEQTPLEGVEVYNLSGKLIRSFRSVGASECTFTLPIGFYVVRAFTSETEHNCKINVR